MVSGLRFGVLLVLRFSVAKVIDQVFATGSTCRSECGGRLD